MLIRFPPKESSTSRANLSQPTPRRRRVPIHVIDAAPSPSAVATSSNLPPPSKATNDTADFDSLLKSVSTRKISGEGHAAPNTPDESSPNTFQKAKQTREAQRPSRVGGGIFRANGESSLFKSTTSTDVPEPKQTPTTPLEEDPVDTTPNSSLDQPTTPTQEIPVLPPPASLFDLGRSWTVEQSDEHRFALLIVRLQLHE